MPELEIEKTLYREITFERADIDEESRTVSLAFSSETPVSRWFGKEILDHSKGAVDLRRLRNGGAVLWGHDSNQLVGVVQKASVDNDRRGRAVVRFAETPDAENIWQKVVQGIARHVSVGYRIDKLSKESEDDTGATYRATKWTPYEVSMVSVPADSNVGVGRNLEDDLMTVKDATNADGQATVKKTPDPVVETRALDTADIAKQVANELRADAEKRGLDERARCDEIRKLGKDHQRETLAIEAIEGGKTPEEFRSILLEASKQKPGDAPTASKPFGQRIEIDSVHRGSLKAYENTREGLEKAYRAGMWARAVVFGDQKATQWCRDYGVRVMTGVTGGQSSVVPNEMVQAIIDLREEYGVARQQCYVHPMSSDTATVPRRKSGVTAYFTGRNVATTASDADFDDINLVAREISALTRIDKSYAEDAIIDLGDFITREMAYAFAVKEDDCLFNGTGASAYGGIYGIRPKIIDGNHTAGAIDAASGNDTFAEITTTDLVNVMGALPDYPGIMAAWYTSKRGRSLVFDRLALAAGGNRKPDFAAQPVTSWIGDPIVISQSMPKIVGDQSNVAMMVYGDLNMGVTFGDRVGFEVEILRERYAEYRQIGVIARERFAIVVHGLGDTSDAGPIVALIGE